ncbi:MAG: hypothetical protein ACE5FI_13040 [Anaerolineales bacterium]
MNSDGREQLMVWTLRGLAASFAVVGLLFLFAPDGTLAFGDALGARLGTFAPAPPTGAKLWLSLAVSYMALVTALAYLAARDVRANAGLLRILALGKAASSLTSLVFFLSEARVFIYLLNFVVDGGIALLVLGCWRWIRGMRATNGG